jgi:hypothetical protein
MKCHRTYQTTKARGYKGIAVGDRANQVIMAASLAEWMQGLKGKDQGKVM